MKIGIGEILLILSLVPLIGSCAPHQAPTSSKPGNQAPVISSLTVDQQQTIPGGKIKLTCYASDPDNDEINFSWECTGGKLEIDGPNVVWEAPEWEAAAETEEYQIIVTVKDKAGLSTKSRLTLQVVKNQSPLISKLVAEPTIVRPGAASVIMCDANDPDGDEINFHWSAKEGQVSGVGKRIMWIAPKDPGTYNIEVLVSDGKGGETTASIPVKVASVEITEIFNPEPRESGTVSSRGDRDNSRTIAGDDNKNIGYRAFWSFNLLNLLNTDVKEAKINFVTKIVVGDPFAFASGLKGMQLWKVEYGQDGLPEFNITGTQLPGIDIVMLKSPTVIDVTSIMVTTLNSGATRFQVEALFQSVTNGNYIAEFVEWSDVTLEVTYSKR